MIRWLYIVFLALLFACDTSSNVQSPNKNYFIKYFGGDGDQIAKDLIINKDGTFFILGNSKPPDGSQTKVYLAKANAFGELINQITFGIDMDARDFALTSDGKIAVISNKGVSSSNVDILLTTFTPNLVPLDSLVLFTGAANNYSEYANSITELSNNDFIVEGYVLNNVHPFQELHIKVYNQGSLIMAGPEWQQLNGSGTDNRGVRTFQHNSNSYYTFGTTNATYQSANKKFWSYALPSNGSGTGNSDYSMFEKAGAGLENTLTDVVKIKAGGYLLVGVSGSSTAYNLKASVTVSSDTALIFSPSGVFKDLLLQDLGNSSTIPYVAAYSSVSNYSFILSSTYNTPTARSDISLTKVNNALVPMWGNSATQEPPYIIFGGDGEDTAAAVAELSDGHIMVLGTMQLGNPPAQSKIALMKLNANGKLAD